MKQLKIIINITKYFNIKFIFKQIKFKLKFQAKQ